MGHLPKYHDESAQAWIYGKLLIALLTEKITCYADSLSPWGVGAKLQSLAQLPIMYHQVRRTIIPLLSLQEAMHEWGIIRRSLSEQQKKADYTNK